MKDLLPPLEFCTKNALTERHAIIKYNRTSPSAQIEEGMDIEKERQGVRNRCNDAFTSTQFGTEHSGAGWNAGQ